MLFCISEENSSQPYDAKIELDGTDVLLHSRGGPTGGRPARNKDYEKALTLIIQRLRLGRGPEASYIRRVLLDSSVARRAPKKDRLLLDASEFDGTSIEEAVRRLRQRAQKWGQKPGTKGGNSTKALRIETAGLTKPNLVSTLKLSEWRASPFQSEAVERLSHEQQRRVSFIHIHNAVSRLLAGEDADNFSDSRDYDVLSGNGQRLAPKKVFALALEEVLGFDIHPAHFSAGWGQPCFDIIQASGFEIVKKKTQSSSNVLSEVLGDLPHAAEDRSAIEGDEKLVVHLIRERARGLAGKKKADFVLKHGRLFCERCGLDPIAAYGPSVGVSCIEVHHAVVQVKDMQPGHETSLDDLQCLCANCHRVTHREMSLGLGEAGSRNNSIPKPCGDGLHQLAQKLTLKA